MYAVAKQKHPLCLRSSQNKTAQQLPRAHRFEPQFNSIQLTSTQLNSKKE